MIDDSPIGISEREWERGLWWMVLASGGMHVLLIALLLLIPESFAHHPRTLVSYTVDLVAPDKVGGTNLVPGGKGRVEAAPLVPAAPPAPKVEPPPPAPPKVAEAKPPEAKPEPQKPPAPEKPAPQEPAPQEVASKAEPPKAEQKPKAEPKPKEDEAAVALKAKKVEPPPAPTAVKAAPSPAVKAAPSPKVVAKAEPAKAHPAASPKANPEAAKKAAAEAAARQRDERILAAVKRVEQQAGARGGGTGQKTGEPPGGPISVGPGQGAGGTVIGLEYQLYYNALINRLKQSWAWAGADRSLEAVVRFSIKEDGSVVDVRITHPSGDPSYDLSVERAVQAVNPLPPPPDAYRKEFGDVEITFSPENLQM